jgi:hypothetical protein
MRAAGRMTAVIISEEEGAFKSSHWMLDVGCWVLDVSSEL